jgi:cyclopropane fatty-acyl-phospholipid synthase-like methyltransferase
MTEHDREKWDTKYLDRQGISEPSSILVKYWNLAPGRHALDIACGNGRNSLFLAENGFTVDAVDISTVATSRLEGRHPNINVICTDLDTWVIPPGRYDLIVNIKFLDRRLFPMIRDGLKNGGVLVFESFMDVVKDEYCLKQNELLRAFQDLRVVYYEEKEAEHHREKFDRVASLVAIKTS